jgi:hypothetical protein
VFRGLTVVQTFPGGELQCVGPCHRRICRIQASPPFEVPVPHSAEDDVDQHEARERTGAKC